MVRAYYGRGLAGASDYLSPGHPFAKQSRGLAEFQAHHSRWNSWVAGAEVLRSPGPPWRSILTCILVALAGCEESNKPLPRLRITEEAAVSVQPDMPRAQVEDALGGPAGNYRAGPLGLSAQDLDYPSVLRNGARLSRWIGDEGAVYVYFDKDDVVYYSFWVPLPRVSP